MEAFVKSFATYRTIKKASVISSALTLDALEKETSTVTVVGTAIGRGDTGNWLIIDGCVFHISNVKPQKDRTILTLTSPLDAFSRLLELSIQRAASTVGKFVSQVLTDNWVACSDAVYAMPYLSVSNSDTAAYVEPELDNSGCFDLPEYARLMRKTYRTTMRFTDAGSNLLCTITTAPVTAHQVSFEDGRSQLQSVDYSTAGTAKLTVLCDTSSGDTVTRSRSTWYLSENGEISETVPARRASGKWSTITVNKAADIEKKVAETFAKNKANHKLEFWSSLELAVLDDCTFMVYGELLMSYISYKRKSSTDQRYYYKSGELATTATEKLRGVTK